MGDETSSTEEKVEKDPATETGTVKKKEAKKKSAKKKVAKKKATTKKKVAAKKSVSAATPDETAAETVAKSATPDEPAAETVAKSARPDETAAETVAKSATPDEPAAETITKSATPTAVAAASAVASKPSVSASSKPAPSNVTVQAELKKETTPEDSSMTTDSKSTSGFRLKVIFWLVIIILGFMYIRSLAIKPKPEDITTAVEKDVVETTTTAHTPTTSEATGEEAVSAVAETGQQGVLESGYSVSAPGQETIMVESAPADTTEQTADTGQARDAADVAEETVATDTAGDDAAVTDSEAISSMADEVKSIRDLHAESVSKILKEFDDLRNATKAEIEAMRNRIQAERELREAMAPPAPWRGRGYAPYGGYPPSQQGYSPYYGR